MRIVIINGRGGSGKDTVCEMAQEMIGVGYCMSISTIDVVKDLAEMMFVICGYGWDGKKDERGRRLLADLKDAWQRYDEGPRKHVVKRASYMARLWGENKGLLFIHSREPEDIIALKESLSDHSPITLLVKNPNIGDHGNRADDNVEDYRDYDYIISNSGTMQELKNKVRDFVESVNLQK